LQELDSNCTVERLLGSKSTQENYYILPCRTAAVRMLMKQ